MWSRSVHWRLMSIGMTQLALFLDHTQDWDHSRQVLLLPELSQVREKFYVLLQVDFVRTSDDTRIDVLHVVPSACFRVLTHTLCIFVWSPSLLDFHLRHHQA